MAIYLGQSQGITDTGKFYQKFGAVEVGPFTFYEMLKRNETILLFPGGANEALHAKGEDYLLKWPEKVDFVRMAGTYYECCVVVSILLLLIFSLYFLLTSTFIVLFLLVSTLNFPSSC